MFKADVDGTDGAGRDGLFVQAALRATGTTSSTEPNGELTSQAVGGCGGRAGWCGVELLGGCLQGSERLLVLGPVLSFCTIYAKAS